MALAEMANLSIDEIRGSGPPALIQRIEHLEEEVERLADDQAAADREAERVGALLAQMIGVLDQAGVLPDRPPGGDQAIQGVQRAPGRVPDARRGDARRD
jgi:hypothetical protein